MWTKFPYKYFSRLKMSFEIFTLPIEVGYLLGFWFFFLIFKYMSLALSCANLFSSPASSSKLRWVKVAIKTTPGSITVNISNYKKVYYSAIQGIDFSFQKVKNIFEETLAKTIFASWWGIYTSELHKLLLCRIRHLWESQLVPLISTFFSRFCFGDGLFAFAFLNLALKF